LITVAGRGVQYASPYFNFQHLTAMTIPLTYETFKTKVFDFEKHQEWKFEGDKPCLIDFWAAWCGPCRMIAPILEELSEEYKDQINIYKVDTEAEQELAAMFGIRSIPSLLFVPMNGKPQMAAGALPKEVLKEIIDKELLGRKIIVVS
jgi:thioredoxin 1